MPSTPHSPIQFFGQESAPTLPPGKPVNALFLTSVRDTGSCDKNGSMVETKGGKRYMEGILERTISETRARGALGGILRVVGVITDDLERDMRGSEYPVRPEPDRLWLHGMDLRTEDGALLAGPNMTHWIPSDFRALPLRETDARIDRKREFERQVFELMGQTGADVLISDHYMARIEYLVNGTFQKFGRILNIHPAVTIPDHPFRFCGKTPTQDAIDMAKTGEETRTGATLHIIDDIIDHGPPIAFIAETPVYEDDTPQELRYRNYQQGKLPLFASGIRHYVQSIYPHLESIDLNNLSPLHHVPVAAPR